MREINIAKVLARKRKEKGMTQEDVSNFIGVSKASVSKWETGQSYPDITMLPLLASFFNTTIDDLMDYQPQLEPDDIRKLCDQLSRAFDSQPWDEALNQCREITKKYSACFPLLKKVGMLILNHSTLLQDVSEMNALIQEAKRLFVRVKEESDDIELIHQAVYLEASCCMALGDPNKALDLLGEMNPPLMPVEWIKSYAYQMLGNTDSSKAFLQMGMYRHVVTLFGLMISYLMTSADHIKTFEEIYRRALALAEAFDFKHLNPNLYANLFLTAALGYTTQGDKEQALDNLKRFTELAARHQKLTAAGGDSFFDLIHDQLAEWGSGMWFMGNTQHQRKKMYEMIANHPELSAFVDDPRFKKVLEKLICNVWGEFR
ncbi:helix-turn-helix domain-containing protein [Paenibacillus cellulositrophicus]|uniref:helix-turn-helix domain-containing protein n=1 Tax=Paenibacillus cellulositrophicus TaxID=562959 RepID=UPI002040D9FF|nr:helix-turn-helix domain-containing protein [Paenibacillus cellulositrophicus]MCM2998564.1 helix-turn-helix domain-containing protein [Paenibacillus cellulositrophicus]